jgi:hypothetical protein
MYVTFLNSVFVSVASENNGPVNVVLLMQWLAKADLSNSEIQNLIDLLLNKQQDSTIDAEWIGVRVIFILVVV